MNTPTDTARTLVDLLLDTDEGVHLVNALVNEGAQHPGAVAAIAARMLLDAHPDVDVKQARHLCCEAYAQTLVARAKATPAYWDALASEVWTTARAKHHAAA